MENTNHAIKLPNFSWKILKEVLTSIPWAVTPKEIVVAGTMDATDRIKLEPEPTGPALESWKSNELELELSADEFAVCKRCLEVVTPKGILFVNKFSAALLTAFS